MPHESKEQTLCNEHLPCLPTPVFPSMRLTQLGINNVYMFKAGTSSVFAIMRFD